MGVRARVNVPFGLITEYDDDFIGRFQGIKSDVKTININPALSWKVNDRLALGVGVNWQRIDANFTSAVNYSGVLAQAAGIAGGAGAIPAAIVPSIIGATPGLESKSTVDGDDSAWGWNVGLLWDVNALTRVGVSYRSPIKYKVTGNVGFDNPTPSVPAPLAPVVRALAQQINSTVLFSGGMTSDIKLPGSANLSIFQSFNDRWDWMADVQWTGWSTLKDLTFVRTTGSVLQSTPENFDDTWRFSAGASYKYSDQWKFRGGVAFDQSPVNDDRPHGAPARCRPLVADRRCAIQAHAADQVRRRPRVFLLRQADDRPERRQHGAIWTRPRQLRLQRADRVGTDGLFVLTPDRRARQRAQRSGAAIEHRPGTTRPLALEKSATR